MKTTIPSFILPKLVSRRRSYELLGGIGLIMVISIGAGLFYFNFWREARLAHAAQYLGSAADTRAALISNWRDEWVDAASEVAESPFTARHLGLTNAVPENEREGVRSAQITWMTSEAKRHHSSAIIALDIEFKPLPGQPELTDLASDILRDVAKAQPESWKRVELPPRLGADKRLVLDLISPLRESPDGPVLGYILQRADSGEFLEVAIHAGMPEIPTFEATLWWNDAGTFRRLGDGLQTMRGNVGSWLSTDDLVMRVAKGVTSLIEATDFRGIPVVGRGRIIPGAPWVLVVRQGRVACLAPVTHQSIVIAFGLACLLSLAWIITRRFVELRQIPLERDNAKLAARLGLALNEGSEAILLWDINLRLLEANKRAEELYGYSKAELTGINPDELRADGARVSIEERFASLSTVKSTLAEGLHRRKNGETFPAEVSGRQVTLDGKPCFLTVVRDITLRRHAEEALHESEARYRTVTDHAPEAIVVYRENTLLYANQSALRLFRVKEDRDTLIGRPLQSLVHPSFLPLLAQMMERRLSAVTSVGETVERTIFANDGTRLDVEVQVITISYAGKPAELVSLRDVTERKRAQAALRVADSQLSRAFLGSPLGMTVEVLNGGYLRVNPSYCAIVGYSEEELLAADFRLVTHPDDVEASKTAMYELVVGQRESFQLKKRILHKSGRLVWLRMHASLVWDDFGQTRNLISHVQDITQHREAQAAIISLAHRNEVLLQTASDGIHVIDGRGRIIEANDAFCQMLGYARGELLERYISEVDAHLTGEEQDALIQRIAASATLFETKHRRKDGSVLEVEVSAKAVIIDGAHLIYASSRDITERKRLEGELASYNARFRAIFEHSPVGLSINLRGVVRVNAEHARITGLPLATVITPGIFRTVTHPDDLVMQDRVRAEFDARREDSFEIVKRYRGNGSEWIWARLSSRRIVDAGSGQEMEVSTLVDLTAIMKAEQAVKESEAKYRAIVDGSQDAIILLAAPDWHCEAGNPAAVKMFGLQDAATLATLSPWELSPDRQPDGQLSSNKAPALIDQAMREGFLSFEWMLHRGDGRDFMAHVMLTRVRRGPKTVLQVTMRDITQMRLAETNLRNSEADMREAQRIARTGSFSLSVPSGIWTCSPELDRIMGIDGSYPHTLPGWAALIHPDDREELVAYVTNEVLTRGSRFDREYRILRHSDGELRWVNGLAQLELDARGRPIVLRGTVQDITERHQANEELRRSRALLSAVNEGTPDCIYVKDRHGVYLMVNAATSRFLGKTIEAMIGKNDKELFPAPEASAIMEADRSVLASGTPQTFEEIVTGGDGSVRTFLSTKGPVRDANGVIVGLFGVARDITERKRIENELKRLSRAVEQAPLSVVITDTAGRIQYVNPYVAHLTGYSEAELLGQNPRILKSGETRQEVYNDMWQTLRRREVWRGEFSNRKKDGALFTELATLAPVLDEAGSTVSFVAIKEDITERKAQEQQLARVSRLHQTLSRLGEVMAREKDRDELLDQVCAILGEGGFKLVWIGWRDPATNRIKPVARWGDCLGFVDSLGQVDQLSFSESSGYSADPQGFAGESFRNGGPSIYNDFLNDPRTAAWHARARTNGLASAIGLPIRVRGQIIGTVSAYAGTVDYFQEQEIALMMRVVENLAFTLDAQEQDSGRLLAELELRESETRFRELFDLETDAILVIDLDTDRILQANQAAGVIYGASVEHLRSIPSLSLTDEPASSIETRQWMRDHPGQVQQVEHRWNKRLDGTRFSAEFSARSFMRDGDLLAVFAVRDITEQVESRERLQRFAAELETQVVARTAELAARNRETQGLLQSIPDMVVRLRTDGTVLFCQAAQGFTGLASIGLDHLEVGPPPKGQDPHPLRVAVEATGREALIKGAPVVTEAEVDTPLGQVSVEVRAAPAGEEQSVVFIRDITARRRLEAEMSLALSKEREASEMKSRFIAVTSHEFRTPMAAALAAADLLSRHSDQLSPSQRQSMLSRIDESMRRMSVMLDELLTLNRVSSGRTVPKVSEVDLRELIEEITEELRLGDGAAHRFHLASSGDCSGVDADPEILRHVLTNLMNNAMRYSPKGSLVSVRMGASAPKYVVSVTDTGMGIPLADQGRLFSPFERGSNTTGITGSGLGLSIARQMAGLLGGNITFTSEEGKGSTFTAEFPRPPVLSSP